MNSTFVHGQPKVLGQCAGVPLQDVKDSGAIEWPLANERHVGFIALPFGEIGGVAVLAGYVLRTDTGPHVFGYVSLYDGPTLWRHEKKNNSTSFS